MTHFKATLKKTPEDFVVDEIPLYLPSGEGSHLYVRFRKRDMNTDWAVRGIARAIGADARDAGVPGTTDRRAITTQMVSFALPRGVTPSEFEGRVRAVAIPDLEILEASYHGNKLRTGHLTGNLIRIVLRDVQRSDSPASFSTFEHVGR